MDSWLGILEHIRTCWLPPACSEHIRVTVTWHVEASQLDALHHTTADAKNADYWILIICSCWTFLASSRSSLYVFVLWLAFKVFFIYKSCTTFRVLLLRIVSCASIPLAVRASSLFRHFAMVSAYALPFLTLGFNFSIYWLRLFLAPAFL